MFFRLKTDLYELIYRGFSVDVGVVEINAKEKGKSVRKQLEVDFVANLGNRRYYIQSKEKGKSVRKQLEVDFVANLGNRRYYIQSAYAIPDKEKMEQEQASLVCIPDSFKKKIVVESRMPLWRNEQGITIMNICDFLLDENSLDK